MGEICGAFFGWKFVEGLGDFAPEAGHGASGGLAQECLELGKDLFDGIEVG